MKKHAKIVRFSASIDSGALAILKKRAKRLHGGNVSAVIAELAQWAKEREGREALLEWLGGPAPMTQEERETIDGEIHGTSRVKKSRKSAA